MALLKPGTRLRSAVCTTEVIVIRAPSEDVALSCGGEPMLSIEEQPSPGKAIGAGKSGGTLLGKRYVDGAGSLEVLCTKPGEGSLELADQPLGVKEAKPLPASD